MKFAVRKLLLSCKQAHENLTFTDFNYYYGQMGAGKSTIARLIDFCLGGELEYTLAIQQEFVAASLELQVGETTLVLTRNSGEKQIRAQWSENGHNQEALLPARQPAGEVAPGSGIQLPSDLLFHLAGVRPPRVRAGKDESDGQEVLSFSDLFSYCYLDQDSMDSTFFGLGSRPRSRDVIRHLVGWHHEGVMQLESQFQTARAERRRCEGTLQALTDALASENLPAPPEIAGERERIQQEIQHLDSQIASIRSSTAQLRPHGVDTLQNKGRKLARQLAELDEALREIEENISKDKTHRNTLEPVS